MNSLVTGGCGFIGSHIVDRLVSIGHNVRVIDNLSSGDGYTNPKAEYHNLSITDYESIAKLFVNADNVFHLAAESKIGPCLDNPQKACETNFVGTCNVLQASREENVKRFIYSGTSAVYGLANKPPMKESMPNDCLNPYSLTKTSAEELVRMYNKLWGLNTISFRYFNVYGERQPESGQYAPVIAIFLKQLRDNTPLTIIGDGSQSRDFVYIDDVVDANMLALKTNNQSAFGEVFNIGSGKNISVLEIAKLISDKYEFLPSRLGEAQDSLADISKAKKLLEFNPLGDVSKWIKKKM